MKWLSPHQNPQEHKGTKGIKFVQGFLKRPIVLMATKAQRPRFGGF